MLKHYETKAKQMTTDQLNFAIRDLRDTLKTWQHESADDNAKLHAEFEAYTVERNRRIGHLVTD